MLRDRAERRISRPRSLELTESIGDGAQSFEIDRGCRIFDEHDFSGTIVDPRFEQESIRLHDTAPGHTTTLEQRPVTANVNPKIVQ